jgi:hypothetical protein
MSQYPGMVSSPYTEEKHLTGFKSELYCNQQGQDKLTAGLDVQN